MIEANKLLSERVDYPLHLGVTEAGFGIDAAMKSSLGIGSLLSMGIGDTIRVSLTDAPEEEVKLASKMLSELGLRERQGMNIISCPTCGRTKIDLISLTRRFTEAAEKAGILDKPISVALMGCAVNGPGEAREADIGIAGGIECGLLFKGGEILRKIPEDSLIDELIDEILKM
jgi:(E)-4-hydroxy-3-methylbut-2-enyl-diphosphate synthase